MKTPHSYHLSFLGGFALLIMSLSAARADTLYWARTTDDLTWANSGNPNWNPASDGSGDYQTWVASDDAVIVAPSAVIDFGGSIITAGSLTVTSGASFTMKNSTNTGLIISGANGFSGSGNFSMKDNPDSTASLKMEFTDSTTGHTAYQGTITVGAFANASSGLQLGADSKASSPSNPLTGTGVDTHVVLDGGRLLIGGGVAGTTAVIGSLSGSGGVVVGNVFSSNSGTRTLEIDQSADTTFSGDIGSTTITQTNNVLALTKSGTGRLTIEAGPDSGYSGDTTVRQGALYLSGTFGNSAVTSAVNQGNFIVKAGATLGLDGTVNLGGSKTITIEDGGVLDPGTLVVNGAGTTTSVGLVTEGTATLRFTLGASQDKITFADASMKGSAAGGDGSILFDFTDSGDAAVGQTYDLIDFGSTAPGIVLTAFALSQASIDAGWAGAFAYGGDGNLLQFTVGAIPVPEPGAFALAAGAAAAGVFLLRRLRRPSARSVFMGLVAVVAAGLAVSRASAAPNLIANGGFEDAAAGWTVFVPTDSKGKGCAFSLDNAAAHEGQAAACLKAETPARFCISPGSITVQPGYYDCVLWVRAGPGFAASRRQPGFVLRVSCFNPGEKEPVAVTYANWKGEVGKGSVFPDNDPVPAGWTQVKVPVIVSAGGNRVRLDFFLWQAKGALMIDDVLFARRGQSPAAAE